MKRWRSIRRKIAKNSNRKGIYSHSIWNNFRKPGIYLMVTVILLITKVGILYTYGGEFGGFDIDIGYSRFSRICTTVLVAHLHS